MNKISEILSATTLFHGLNADDYHDYWDRTHIRLVCRGETLVNEGDPCTGIGLILEGQLAMQAYTSNGDFTTLGLLGADDVFGEQLIFGTLKTYPITIEAVVNSKVVFIAKDILMQLLNLSPSILQNFMTILSDRALAQNTRISILSQKNLRQKIANYLLELLHDQLDKEDQLSTTTRHKITNQAVELPVSKEVVARLLAIPRPSFSRELIRMARDKMIRISGRVIWLLDLDRFEPNVTEGIQTS